MTTAQSQAYILDALNIDAYPAREQEELMLTLSDLVFKSAFLRIVAAMDDATRGEFAALIAAEASPEVLDDFLKKRVPGAESATKDALEDLASDLAALDIPART